MNYTPGPWQAVYEPYCPGRPWVVRSPEGLYVADMVPIWLAPARAALRFAGLDSEEEEG